MASALLQLIFCHLRMAADGADHKIGIFFLETKRFGLDMIIGAGKTPGKQRAPMPKQRLAPKIIIIYVIPGKILHQYRRNSDSGGRVNPHGGNIADHQAAPCQLPDDGLDHILPEGQQGGQSLQGGFKIDGKGIRLDEAHIAGEMMIAEIIRQRRVKEARRHRGEKVKKCLAINSLQGLHHRQAARGVAKAMGSNKKSVLHCYDRAGYGRTSISTRRFFRRPSTVSLVASGFSAPKPRVTMVSDGIPLAMR